MMEYYPWRPEYKPPVAEEILPRVTREAFERGVAFLVTIGVGRMANRRCKICWINLDGGKGYMLQRFDWKTMKWEYAGNICDKCLTRAKTYARNTKVP